LHLRFFRAGDGVCCDATLGATYQGATEIVHGGIQAVLLDEASCAAAFFTRGTYVVTGQLAIRYRRPCPTGVPLHVRARVGADEGRSFTVVAELRADGADEVLTRSEGRFYRDARRNV
jgi:acyl-coenzyme A thioesterase PaaI-like protein